MGAEGKKPAELCDICCETYNKSSRKKVQCPFCEKQSCMQCTKRYISSTVRDPHCMHCKVGWNTGFIRTTFPGTWLNKDFKELREKILFDTEIAKIPDTQKFCDLSKRRETLKIEKEVLYEAIKDQKETITKTNKEYEECNGDIWILSEESAKFEELEKLKKLSHDLHLQIKQANADLQRKVEQLEETSHEITKLTNEIEGAEVLENKDEPLFNIACPQQGCRGFVSKKWVCGICKCRVCSECHEVRKEESEHKCDEETKASVKKLKEDSKPCPKCASLIYKISGCDQMWCTQCRTAFSWNTGKIEDDVVHNPHYFAWLRTREEEEIVPARDHDCNEGPYVTNGNTFTIVNKIRQRVENLQTRERVMQMVRLLIHISSVEIPSMTPSYVRNIPQDPNRDIRIRYMMNELEESEFKTLLQKREKDRLKREEIGQILQTFLAVGDDLIFRFLEHGELSIDEFTQQMNEIKGFTNQSLETIAEQYSVKLKTIPENYTEIVTLERPKTKKKQDEKILSETQL